MRPTLLALFALSLTSAGACSAASDDTGPSTAPKQQQADAHTAVAEAPIDAAALEAAGGVAYFAGGCFWGVEHFLEQIDGVLRVESGYMGGHVDSPSYEQVSSQTSGHLETVRVYFDPAKVSYAEVAKRFFEIHDPTQADGQGPDIGPEYLSAVFVTDDAQREVVEDLIRQLRARGFDVVTTIRTVETFWEAEEYHQNYYVRHKKQPYCHTPVDRFGDGV